MAAKSSKEFFVLVRERSDKTFELYSSTKGPYETFETHEEALETANYLNEQSRLHFQQSQALLQQSQSLPQRARLHLETGLFPKLKQETTPWKVYKMKLDEVRV